MSVGEAERVEARIWDALEARIWDALEDPEIPRSRSRSSVWDRSSRSTTALRTAAPTFSSFTAMGCPATEFIQDDIREALLRDPEIDAVGIGVVWDPVWTKDRIRAERARACAGWGSPYGPCRRTVWEVFARKAYEDPLHHVGTATESDEDLALVSAHAI